MRLLCCLLVLSACSFGDDDDDGPLGGSRTVEGTVVDFETDQPIGGAVSVSASGLSPVPRIVAQGAEFTIEGVPENSAFQILASAPPAHRATFSSAVVVETDDLQGVRVPAVSETFLAQLASGFGISPSAARGVLLARIVDQNGAPRAGVPKADLTIPDASGPHILDASRRPAPQAAATSTSGWVVYFELVPGVVSMPVRTNITLDMPASPVAAGAVTIAEVRATNGAAVLPTNVSFRQRIVPIFGPRANGGRGCEACHSGNGPGRDLGGLTLDGSANLIYRELTMERPARVQIATPEKSLLLTMPSREEPADRHPNTTFTSALDADYLAILVWIREGAKDN